MSFSSIPRRLVVPKAETVRHNGRSLRASGTRTYYTQHRREASQSITQPRLSNKWKTGQDKHPNESYMKAGRWSRRDEPQCKENSENWGKRRAEVDAASGRVNFTERAEVRKSESLSHTHTHTQAFKYQFPLHTCSAANVNVELMKEVGQSHIGFEIDCRQSICTSAR